MRIDVTRFIRDRANLSGAIHSAPYSGWSLHFSTPNSSLVDSKFASTTTPAAERDNTIVRSQLSKLSAQNTSFLPFSKSTDRNLHTDLALYWHPLGSKARARATSRVPQPPPKQGRLRSSSSIQRTYRNVPMSSVLLQRVPYCTLNL